GGALRRGGEGRPFARGLSAWPARCSRAGRGLCLARGASAVTSGRLEAVEPLLADAERAFAAGGDEPHEPSVSRALSVLANVPAAIAFLRAELARQRGDAARAVDWDRQALAGLGGEGVRLRSHLAWHLAVADWLRGDLAEAERALAEVAAELQAAEEHFLAMLACRNLGQVQQAQGRLRAALVTYQQGLETASEAGQQLPPAGMAHMGLAEVRYERDELAAAHEHATQGVVLCRQLAITQPLATGLAILARIRQAQGDAVGALDAIRQAERVKLSPQVPTLHNPVPAWRARLLLSNRGGGRGAPRGHEGGPRGRGRPRPQPGGGGRG